MADVELLPTEALRRAALARSTDRGARVARRRIAGRWVQWALLRVLVWVALPILLGIGLDGFLNPAGTLSVLLPLRARPASDTLPAPRAAASPAVSGTPASGPADPGLQLRMDPVEASGLPESPQAQSSASPSPTTGVPRER